MNMSVALWLLMATWCMAVATPEFNFVSSTLGSEMVLQRDRVNPIFGWTTKANADVLLTLDRGEGYQEAQKFMSASASEASANGGYLYLIDLPPMTASFTPLVMTIESSESGERATMTNVLVGEVLFCAGQSNMQYAMPGVSDSEEAIADADSYPNIRLFTVGQNYDMPQYRGDAPQDELYTILQPWVAASAVAVGGTGDVWDVFSGTCWFTGKTIYDNQLRREVPVGLIVSSWGGTVIEAWTQESDSDVCMAEVEGAGDGAKAMSIDDVRAQALKTIKTQNPSAPVFGQRNASGAGEDFDPFQLGSLFNTMIHPFRYTTIKAIVWYQGESNMRDTAQDNAFYTCMMPRMLATWHGMGPSFDGAKMAFTQVSPWTWQTNHNNHPTGFAGIYSFRNAQRAVLDVAQSGSMAMVTAADLGDPDAPNGDIHPRNKQEVGRRLAMALSTLVYDSPAGSHMGPEVASTTVFNGTYSGFSVRVTFTDASLDGEAVQLLPPQVCPGRSTSGRCGYVELVTRDCVSSKARDGGECIVRCNIVRAGNLSNAIDIVPIDRILSEPPVRLRYCLGDYPLMQVYNKAGAPLLHFETVL
jgi:sialate O-acetylesterase